LVSAIRRVASDDDCVKELESQLSARAAQREKDIRELAQAIALSDFATGWAILKACGTADGDEQINRFSLIARDLNSYFAWIEKLLRQLADRRWAQARTTMMSHSETFRAWLPFAAMMSALQRLEELERHLNHVEAAMNSGKATGAAQFLEMPLSMDFVWAAQLDSEQPDRNSLAQVAREIIRAAGSTIKQIEDCRARFEEIRLRESFAMALRSTARRNKRAALQLLEQAITMDPGAGLERLRSELRRV
jgi:hypothetical protein